MQTESEKVIDLESYKRKQERPERVVADEQARVLHEMAYHMKMALEFARKLLH